MTVLNKASRPVPAPALFRLLSDSALSRAALGACTCPLALLDATKGARTITYVNRAFEGFFGYRESETLGGSLPKMLFRGDESLVARLLAEPLRRWEVIAWGRDETPRHVEVALGAVRGVDGALTHWIISFTDRSEVDRLRAEVESLKSLAASSLAIRRDAGNQPARSAHQARVEPPAADELHAERQPVGALHQG